MDSVIDRYGPRRLLSFDRDAVTREPTLEVAHEALIREWPRFRRWLDDDRDGFRLQRHLTESAAAWDTRDRDPGELYRGARLSAALDWASTHDRDLTAVEQDFVGASREHHEADRRRQQQTNRRLPALLVGVGAVAVLAVLAGLLAFQQSQRPTTNARSPRSVDSPLTLLPFRFPIAEWHCSWRSSAVARPSPNTLGALHGVLTGTDGLLAYLGLIRTTRNVATGRKQVLGIHRAGLDVFDVEIDRSSSRSTLTPPTRTASTSAVTEFRWPWRSRAAPSLSTISIPVLG